jgi:hypothetical protein
MRITHLYAMRHQSQVDRSRPYSVEVGEARQWPPLLVEPGGLDDLMTVQTMPPYLDALAVEVLRDRLAVDIEPLG